MQLTLTPPIPHTQDEQFMSWLIAQLQARITEFESALITDLSHISHFANYAGQMTLDKLEANGVNQFRLHYSFAWQINNACADQLHEGRINEKMRLSLSTPNQITFHILRFD